MSSDPSASGLAPFFVFLAISTVTYLVLVEFGKRMLRLE